jgi:hypothetical protein
MYRDSQRVDEVAEHQSVRSSDLLWHGIVDRIIRERPDAADEAAAFLCRPRRRSEPNGPVGVSAASGSGELPSEVAIAGSAYRPCSRR